MSFQSLRLIPLAALAVIACKSSPSASTAAPSATSQEMSPVAAAVVTPVAAPSVPPVASPALVAEIRKGITLRGPSSFEIARATIGQIIDNQPALTSQQRIVPETDQGKPAGFRVYGVTPDSTLGTLGIQNGDRVERIDGTDVTSRDKALATYGNLRTADHFTVVLNRAGQDVTLDYNVK